MAEVKQIREIPAKLAFFQPEYVTDAVESTHLEDHLPVGFSVSNQTNPIYFHIQGSEHWIDFEKSYFEIEGVIEGKDTAQAPVDANSSTEFSLTNNFLHNLFSSIHVNVNKTAVSFSNDNYPYVAYIQNLFNYPQDFARCVGDVYLWSKDDAGKMDVIGRNSDNKGAVARHNWIATGNKVRGILKLHNSLFMIAPYLMSFLNVEIVMNRTEQRKFYFMARDAATFSFKLESIVFRVRKAKLVPSFVESIEQMLHKQGEQIVYPMRDCRVTTKTYSGYGADIIEDNLFHGVLPNRIIIGILDNEAYRGSYSRNPFNFIHNDLQEIGLFLNGVPHPIPMTAMDFTAKSTHRILHHMYDSLQSSNPGTNAVNITKKEFDDGFTLFSFDMSSDQYGGLNHQSLLNQPANIRLHLRFAQGNATKLITLVIYYEMMSRMTVNSSRQVTVYAK